MSLASIPSPATAVWHLGPLPIRAYSLFILAGIVVAAVVADVRLRHRGGRPWMILDIALWAVPFGIVGARAYHLITSPDAYFGPGGHPLGALEIWNGGLGIWGAVAGGALGAWIACRRLGVPLAVVADALAPGLALAQAIGRLGNYFNNELYGRLTTLPWGLQIHEMDPSLGRAVTGPDGAPLLKPGLYQPTFLYELIWDVGVALLVWLADRRFRFGRGRAFALYVMAYTVGRFWVEYLRIDPAHHILGLRVNDWVSILVFLAALVYFLRVRGPRQDLRADADGVLHTLDAPGGAADVTVPIAAADAADAATVGDGAVGGGAADAATVGGEAVGVIGAGDPVTVAGVLGEGDAARADTAVIDGTHGGDTAATPWAPDPRHAER